VIFLRKYFPIATFVAAIGVAYFQLTAGLAYATIYDGLEWMATGSDEVTVWGKAITFLLAAGGAGVVLSLIIKVFLAGKRAASLR
jgi:cellobiose-specific phosphotransferase system component IIC